MRQLEDLDKNIDDYISKVNRRRLLSGLIVTLTACGSLWLILALVEYFGNFHEGTRTTLFFTFLAFTLSITLFQVIVPVLKWVGILKSLNQFNAAQAIGKKLKTVDDKLINVFSLKSQAAENQSTLITASLNQKAQALNVHRFEQLVSYKDALSLLRYLAAPAFVFAGLSLINPSTIFDSSQRLLSYNQSFVPPAPFQFNVVTSSLDAIEGESFELKVTTEGSALPDHVFIQLPENKIRMKKNATGSFEYTFDRIQQSFDFTLQGAGVESERMTLNMLSMPKLLRNTTRIDYPSYTKLESANLVNRNQLMVPEGSTLSWQFSTKNTSTILVLLNDSTISLDPEEMALSDRIVADRKYQIILRSTDGITDTSTIEIGAIPDALPQILAQEQMDSTAPGIRFFNGEISDDYGFSRLTFHVQKKSDAGRIKLSEETVEIGQANMQSFSFISSLDSLLLEPNETLEYFFEIWDNDAFNGSKKMRSQVWTFEVPSESELKAKNDAEANKSKTALGSRQNELEKANKELEQLKKDLLQKKKPDWQDKERMKQLLEDQKKLMESLKKRAFQQKKQTEFNNQFNEYSEELLQKQEQIQEMFDELFDEEFKEKYDEYNKLLEKLNKDQMLEKLDEMKLDNEQLEKERGRTLELVKQLEFEQKLEEAIEKTDKLAKDQASLKEETEEKDSNPEALKKEQDELSKELEELSKELNKLDELNESLEEKNDLPDASTEKQGAKEGMDQAQEELQKNNKKKASEQQKQAQESLEELKSKLQSFQEEQEKDSQSENLEDMRQILENLIDLSHHQEKVMEELKSTPARDPRFVALAKEQKDIIDDTKVVEDSILALSKRVPEISNTLNDEMSEVKSNMDIALDNMTNQRPRQEKKHQQTALVKQQLSMTALNNLAVLFDSMIQQAQKKANSKMKGNGKCDKPGSGEGGKPSAADMKKAQQDLNKQLEKLKKAMEKGENPNGKKPGQQKGTGMGGMSKELATMAAQQAAIRQQLRKMSESLDKDGTKPGSGLKKLEKLMEQTEEDILYQNITQETLKRQQEIMTKLLESEKAEREREMDKKRESKSGMDSFDIPSTIWEEYLEKKEQELELYKTLPPNMKPFYRNRVNGYFSQFSR